MRSVPASSLRESKPPYIRKAFDPLLGRKKCLFHFFSRNESFFGEVGVSQSSKNNPLYRMDKQSTRGPVVKWSVPTPDSRRAVARPSLFSSVPISEDFVYVCDIQKDGILRTQMG